MPKPNAMLERIEAKAEAKYEAIYLSKRRMLLQLGQDAAMIAAHEVLGLGPGRAEKFAMAYMQAMTEIAEIVLDDHKDDKSLSYAKGKVDRKIRSIVGDERFEDWEERYGGK